MVLRIFKMIAANRFLTALECTKFVFGRGSARIPPRELTALPRLPSWFKWPYTYKGEGREKRGRREREGTSTPLRKFLAPPEGFVLCIGLYTLGFVRVDRPDIRCLFFM